MLSEIHCNGASGTYNQSIGESPIYLIDEGDAGGDHQHHNLTTGEGVLTDTQYWSGDGQVGQGIAIFIRKINTEG